VTTYQRRCNSRSYGKASSGYCAARRTDVRFRVELIRSGRMMLFCPPGVYRAQSDTAVLAGVVRDGGYAKGRHVLDVGTGSGALALAAARAGAASVTAVDLSWRSVAATWLNCRLRLAPVTVRRGDLFDPVEGRRFDMIVANPPYVPAETVTLPRRGIARCWDGGLDGRAVLDRICDGAAARLTEDGVLLLVHSAVCGAEMTVRRLADAGMDADVIERGLIPFGPVMRARAALLHARGLIEAGEMVEELVVVGARRA
jgi:release factor glutamine methyltransferase